MHSQARHYALHARQSLHLAAGAAVFISLLGSPVAAQSPTPQTLPPPAWQIAAGNKQAFEVASVRLSPPGSRTRGAAILNPFDETPATGGLFSTNGPLIAYIAYAYKLRDINLLMALSGKLPEWAQSNNTYDIQARADGTPTQDQMRLMMQALLADRFKLAVHFETREAPIYALVLDKSDKPGPELKPHPAGVPCQEKPEKPIGLPPNTAPAPTCGMDGWQADGQMHIRMINVTMDQAGGLLGGLGSVLGDMGQRPVVDQTGLQGHYDINLQFVMQKADGSSTNTDVEVSGPSIQTALKNQLGLKLVKQTGSTNIFVLDHIEKPTEN